MVTWDHLTGIPAIEEGSRDPQLLSNLSRIGPVRVDQHMQSFHLVSLRKNSCVQSFIISVF
jgi:hypothetical protein